MLLYDTPPVLDLHVAALVVEHCDVLMLLVGLGRVDRCLPRVSVNRIRGSVAPLLGIVTNAVKPASENAAAYGYGYGNYWHGCANGYDGHGYAAYDTFATCAYYADAEGGEESRASPRKLAGAASHANRWEQWRSKLRHLRRAFMRWLDR